MGSRREAEVKVNGAVSKSPAVSGDVMFITLEGGEGAGKTTQIVHLAGWLGERGVTCTLTREPGGTALGRAIRAVLLNPDNAGMAPLTELLLYMADRSEHIHQVITAGARRRPDGAVRPLFRRDRRLPGVCPGAGSGLDFAIARARVRRRDAGPDAAAWTCRPRSGWRAPGASWKRATAPRRKAALKTRRSPSTSGCGKGICSWRGRRRSGFA
ncbi:MAG: thymidylate kinase [Desulfobacterales bacterium]|nr:thymidylate kinase [Desulfobacterales bacterium]